MKSRSYEVLPYCMITQFFTWIRKCWGNSILKFKVKVYSDVGRIRNIDIKNCSCHDNTRIVAEIRILDFVKLGFEV